MTPQPANPATGGGVEERFHDALASWPHNADDVRLVFTAEECRIALAALRNEGAAEGPSSARPQNGGGEQFAENAKCSGDRVLVPREVVERILDPGRILSRSASTVHIEVFQSELAALAAAPASPADGEGVIARLRTMRDCLVQSRAGHQRWIDWYAAHPDQDTEDHPIGGTAWQQKSVAKYDERIACCDAAIAALASRPAVEEKLVEALDLPFSWELSWGEVSDEEGAACGWRVHERRGNRSDREWTLLATADTPIEALIQARAALKAHGVKGDE